MEGREMKQINTYALYQLAIHLAPLRSLPSTGSELTKEHGWTLFLANHQFGQFFSVDRVLPLELSGDAAQNLTDAIDAVAKKLWADRLGKWTIGKCGRLRLL